MACNRWFWLWAILLIFPLGCSHNIQQGTLSSNEQRVRVRLLLDVDRVQLAATDNPTTSSESNSSTMVLGFPKNSTAMLTFSQNSWRLGGVNLGSGVLTIHPGSEGSLRVNDIAYRGFYKFVPLPDGKFDVINDVDIDDYLKGVVVKEMLPSWHIEALKAQAVVARTYALYESHTAGVNRYWDLYADQRSQVYGGIPGETAKSEQAVDDTAGIVLTYGDGVGKIFKAYFCSCCGGVTQAAADAFPGDPYIPPLREQSNGTLCNASKYYNWGPITIKKTELARRVLLWAQHQAKTQGHAVAVENLQGVYRMDVHAVNSLGRPTQVTITDTTGMQYTIAAEDMRTAIDTDAAPGTTLPSSYCKINGDPNADSVTFYDGHGFGHGVGMCQYTAEARALAGVSHEQILLAAYPGAKLTRAY